MSEEWTTTKWRWISIYKGTSKGVLQVLERTAVYAPRQQGACAVHHFRFDRFRPRSSSFDGRLPSVGLSSSASSCRRLWGRGAGSPDGRGEDGAAGREEGPAGREEGPAPGELVLLSAAALAGRRVAREEGGDEEDGDDRGLPCDELAEAPLCLCPVDGLRTTRIPRPTPGARYPSVGGGGNVKDESREGGVRVTCGVRGAGASLLGPATGGGGMNDAPRREYRMAELGVRRALAEDEVEGEGPAGGCGGSRPSRCRRGDRSSSPLSPSESCARFR